jgi:hypothetical protein
MSNVSFLLPLSQSSAGGAEIRYIRAEAEFEVCQSRFSDASRTWQTEWGGFRNVRPELCAASRSIPLTAPYVRAVCKANRAGTLN